MVITSMLMGGLFLVGTAIAGLLMFYQLRESSDAQNSASAVFAADAGIEGALRCFNYTPAADLKHCSGQNLCVTTTTLGANVYSNSYVSETCVSIPGAVPPNPTSTVKSYDVWSYGYAGGAERILERSFDLYNVP